MSIESARAYFERMKTDEEFRNRVLNAETAEARLAIVQSEGFDFTKEEVDEVSSDELTDDELDMVAGGWTPCDCPDCDSTPSGCARDLGSDPSNPDCKYTC